MLYILMFLQPLSGYLSSSFSGYTTNLFGIPLPAWGWKDPALNQLLTDFHIISSINPSAIDQCPYTGGLGACLNAWRSYVSPYVALI